MLALLRRERRTLPGDLALLCELDESMRQAPLPRPDGAIERAR